VNEPPRESDERREPSEEAREGDRLILDRLLARHRPRLVRMVGLRMPAALKDRLDPSDVVQEAYAEAARRLPAYLRDRPMPFFPWLRFLARQALLGLYRRHAGTRRRDPRREVRIDRPAAGGPSSEVLAERLPGALASPSGAVLRAETRSRIALALDCLEEREREIIALRHFERLSNSEAARRLKVGEAAASKRYIRAVARLRGILLSQGFTPSLPGGGGP